MQHPDEGLIHAWLDGELDAGEAARVEALVSSDPEWAAAAAEARGLIAASARIVGALDRVPANVVPKAAAKPRGAAHRWMLRAAAALVLVAGSAVVLKRGAPELPAPKPARSPVEEPAQRTAAAVPNAGSAIQAEKKHEAPAAAPAENAPLADRKVTLQKKELDQPKQEQRVRDKDVVAAAAPAVSGELRADAASRRAAAAAGAPAAPSAAQNFATAKTALAQPSCFVQREPRDSAQRLIRLDAGALADSIRLERLTLRGDTLAAVNGRLIAVRAPCPSP